ncbi:MAG: SLC13 family permease [Pelolinea sp.]|nr:SLC13 family permease [Pelolinea sp.]
MNVSQSIILAVLFIPLLAVILGRLRMDVAALTIPTIFALLQYAGLGIFSSPGHPDMALRAFSGFSEDPVVILVSVFILTAALEKSGFARWITIQILKIGGNSTNKLIFLFSGTAALLSLFMNDVAAATLLIPSVMEACRRTGINPGKLLIPVSFGSLLGGMATYFATANIIASSLLQSASPSQEPLNVLSFLPTGGLIALSGLLFMTFFGNRLLPDREGAAAFRKDKLTGSDLEKSYNLVERTWKVRIHKHSPLCGCTLREIGLGENFGIVVAAIRNGKRSLLFPAPEVEVKAGNQLLIIGREERVRELANQGVQIKPEDMENTLSKRGLVIFELLVMPRSGAVGKTLKDLDFRKRYGWSVLALQRGSSNYRTDVGSMRLSVGDSLLAVGESSRRDATRNDRDFIMLEASPADQPLRLKETGISLGLLLASVAVAALGIPVFAATLVAALLVIFSGTISMQEAYESIEWQVIFVVGGMYSISIALVESGLAQSAGLLLSRLAELFGPLGLAGGGFVIASLLSQIMGGQFEMMVTGPIAISAAIQYGLSPQAIALAVALGCSNSFLTPMAHPANLLMMAPGGYKFSDFFKIGWWLFMISFIMLLVGMVVFWKL